MPDSWQVPNARHHFHIAPPRQRVLNGMEFQLYEGWEPYGNRIVTAESARPEPSGQARVEVPVVYR